eukprot:CAMPEP_0171328408 /NCGR_PEP_ID=MMETSP0878-20121228/630_1 /TAXON_ID=67004 /ORGANISM="Thalassiosira weissflogii, Strain CCMP1336" /LENGTH=387 /DNA_ID=CAMNT_0011828259 /DNA_START=40 /DNA_END=1203 /DNA_ORIENTATION=-
MIHHPMKRMRAEYANVDSNANNSFANPCAKRMKHEPLSIRIVPNLPASNAMALLSMMSPSMMKTSAARPNVTSRTPSPSYFTVGNGNPISGSGVFTMHRMNNGDTTDRIVSPDEIVRPTVADQQVLHPGISCVKSMPPPPLVEKRPPSPSFDSTKNLNAVPATKTPQNPLDFLSTISTCVAEREQEEASKKQQEQQQQRHQQQLAATSSLAVIQDNIPKSAYRPILPNSANDESYVGQRNSLGQRYGKGAMNYSNGCRYVGQFLHDKRHGFGKCWYPNGCIYVGYWVNGKRDGLGKMLYLSGDIYEGEWMGDQRHGVGVYYCTDGVAEVCRYDRHDVVGEGVQFSPCRSMANRLVDGRCVSRMSLEKALGLCALMGIKSVPTRMPQF